MCGISGSFSLDGSPSDRREVEAMSAALRHRGPDDEGICLDGPAGLGFCRLSILDLEGGHQPMLDPEGRFALVFNGEIYNHPELKAELESSGVRYRTRSDTETILHCFRRDGIRALSRLEGMFALALWDRTERRLLLARDPVGIKPLYYAVHGKRLYFASELRALVRAGVPRALDAAALEDYLSYGYVHAPATILAAVKKLEPGRWLEADKDGIRLGTFFRLQPPEPEKMGLRECEERLGSLLAGAVRSQLLSDVPVGAFLSGGLDSSLITALMAERGPVDTFSIGFEGARPGLDESAHARRAAAYLGTRHHELMLPANVLSRMEDALASLDEPIGDSAVLPTLLLARHARKTVKVVLTGEGADELFGGYRRHKAAYLSHATRSWAPAVRAWALGAARRWGSGPAFKGLPLDDVRSWAEACRASAQVPVRALLSRAAVEASDASGPAWLEALDGLSGFNGALAHDLRTNMADDLLMKVDKATMNASLEARVPYLDLKLLDFSFRIPPELKLRLLRGKWILRRLAAGKLPASITARRKHGFWAPWEEWVRSPSAMVDEGVRQLAGTGLLDEARSRAGFERLRQGSRAEDAGLYYRIAMLGLWRMDAESRAKETP